jgi:RNA polymerase sigma-70 factor (ECF subfamily)
MTPTDSTLLKQIQSQDEKAFETLTERYETQLWTHTLRTVRNEAAADDLMQEIFLRVWPRAGQWQGQGSVKGWLYRIATNLVLNHLRTVRRRRDQALEIPTSDDNNEITTPAWMIDADAVDAQGQLEKAESAQLLQQLIKELPEDKREVIRLVHESETGVRGAAKVLDITEGTVKSSLHYTVKQLTKTWYDYQNNLHDLQS